MTPARIVRAIAERARVISRYAGCAPDVAALPKWLVLGCIRARLTGGEARLPPESDAGTRDWLIRIGPQPHHRVRLDMSSFAELDGFEEIFLRRIYRLDDLPFRPELVVDCGANIGLFASVCRIAFPEARIFCWEPEARNLGRLKAQPLLQTDLGTASADAVSDADGWLPFSGRGLGGKVAGDGDEGSRRVRATHLRPWLLQHRHVPTLVKIDVEGFEEHLVPSLAGAWPDACLVYLETHQEAGKDAAILQCLAQDSFRWVLQGTHELPEDSRQFNEYLATRLDAGRPGVA